jgi:hypothetical protein
MPISHSKKFIFVHIPKCAGTSVHHVLSRCSSDYVLVGAASLSERIRFGEAWLHHATGIRIRRALSAEQWNTYFKFTIVRNPWDRLVSLYHYFLTSFPPGPRWWRNTPIGDYFRHPMAAARGILDVMEHRREQLRFASRASKHDPANFTRWLKEALDQGYVHCRPCAEYVTDSRGHVIVDDIIRFEAIEAGFAQVCRRLGFPDAKLPVENVSAHKEFGRYYTAETAALVGRRFAEDVRLFGYHFPKTYRV